MVGSYFGAALVKMLDLFSGIGGFHLAAEWVWGDDLEVVAHCEIEPFPQKVLRKHWPDVPIVPDIHNLNGDRFGTVDLITGGFPCQPYSVAGKRRGAEDDRALWPEMLRVIREARPRWIIGENVAGFVNMGLDDCCADLEIEGYEVQPVIIPACAVGAPHRRDRVWIVAYSEVNGSTGGQGEIRGTERRPFDELLSEFNDEDSDVAHSECRELEKRINIGRESRAYAKFARSSKGDAANAESAGLERRDAERARSADGWIAKYIDGGEWYNKAESWREPWPEVAARLCRVDDGLPRRVDRVNRLKALGNAIVPQVAAVIMQAIKTIEDQ